MKPLTNGEFALAVLVTSLFWILVIALNASHAASFWTKTTDDPVAMFTLVLAVSTIGLWVATLWLYLGGEKHSERQLRAYIVATVQADIQNFNAAARPLVILGFVNAGQTPAHDVRVFTSCAVAKFPLNGPPKPPEELGPGHSEGVIGPQGTFHIRQKSHEVVTVEEHRAVQKGAAAFYVYGEVFYRDAFKRQLHTRFCHFYHGEAAKNINGPLASYHKWNEAT